MHEPWNQLLTLFHILTGLNCEKRPFSLGHQTCDVIGNTCIYPAGTCQNDYCEKDLGMCRKREQRANEIRERDRISTKVKIPLLCDM